MFRPFAVLLLALVPLAAEADTHSTTWTPRTTRQADALRAGLALHSLRTELRSGGTVRQWGRDNLAALSQSGSGNWGGIYQRGSGHSATLTQSGDGNAHAIVQAGRDTAADVDQAGGEVGLTLQIGW